jgi:hypothetical protein
MFTGTIGASLFSTFETRGLNITILWAMATRSASRYKKLRFILTIKNLETYVRDEYKTKKNGEFDIGSLEIHTPGPDAPQQQNVYDCGVFMCKFADYLARDLPLTFSQRNIPFFRKQMALQIVQASMDV